MRYQVENFVSSVFVRVEKQFQTDPLSYQRCFHFIEMLGTFGPLSEEWAKKRDYCKWKAAFLKLCSEKGIEVEPGNPSLDPKNIEMLEVETKKELQRKAVEELQKVGK